MSIENLGFDHDSGIYWDLHHEMKIAREMVTHGDELYPYMTFVKDGRWQAMMMFPELEEAENGLHFANEDFLFRYLAVLSASRADTVLFTFDIAARVGDTPFDPETDAYPDQDPSSVNMVVVYQLKSNKKQIVTAPYRVNDRGEYEFDGVFEPVAYELAHVFASDDFANFEVGNNLRVIAAATTAFLDPEERSPLRTSIDDSAWGYMKWRQGDMNLLLTETMFEEYQERTNGDA